MRNAIKLVIFATLLSNAALAQQYRPHLSEMIEADNGARYAVDLNTARHFGPVVEAGIYDQGRGGIIPMMFDCRGHAGPLGGNMSPTPARSVGARLAAIACAAARP